MSVNCSIISIIITVSREFSYQFSRKRLTPSKRDQLFSAAEHLCPVAISKPYQESSPSGSGLSLSRKPRLPSGSEYSKTEA